MHVLQHVEAVPSSEQSERKKYGDKWLSCPSHSTHQENGKPQQHAPGPGMQEDQDKLKSTSEVTLQDSNLEVY